MNETLFFTNKILFANTIAADDDDDEGAQLQARIIFRSNRHRRPSITSIFWYCCGTLSLRKSHIFTRLFFGNMLMCPTQHEKI